MAGSELKSLVRLVFIFNLLTLFTSIFFLIYNSYWTTRPGPNVYYSPFWTIVITSCLVFQTLQNLIMLFTIEQPRSITTITRITDMVVSSLTGIMSGACFIRTSKPDAAALSFLAASNAICVICWYWISRNSKMPSSLLIRLSSSDFKGVRPVSLEAIATSERRPQRHIVGRICSWINVFLIVIHACILILSTAGSIELALSSSYTNPGTVVEVTLPTGQVRAVNHYCTTVNATRPANPTLWFEGSSAHGVVDFLGIQTILAQRFNRRSCSYDPPNFGWSDPLPASLQDYESYFNPLLRAIGLDADPKIVIGWGDGARYALLHALEDPDTTTDLVIMDASPDGIEWLDAQRANGWDEKQMLDYRQQDLQGRIGLCRLILGIAIPWGLMPIFFPSNSTGYFENKLYARYRAQTLKEDLWASQYYLLKDMAKQPINNFLVNTTAPAHTRVHSLMTYNSGQDDASNTFYRREKLKMVNHIAGKNIIDQVIWCNSKDCSLDFPVEKAKWTADALISLGI